MRYRWIYGAAAISMFVFPIASQAQANPCTAADSSGGNRPTCSVTKDATATIGNILTLEVGRPDVNLIAGVPVGADTIPFAKTYHADSLATTGTDLSGNPTARYKSTDSSWVVAQGNRGFVVNVKSQDPIFTFESNGGVCRTSAIATTSCTTSETLAGKGVGDVYLKPENGASAGQWFQLKTTDTQLFSTATGDRFASGIELSSAWFYATDIAGSYTATLVYTITGQ